MMADHMLPMLQVQDKTSGEMITHIFNFIDNIGDLDSLSAEKIEHFLKTRGILKPDDKFQD
jgi:hypothetical protein